MRNIVPIVAVIFTLGFVLMPLVWSDNDFEWREHGEHEEFEYRIPGFASARREYEEYKQRSTGIPVIENPVYREECGACHMAYPAGLLPAVSWEKLMLGLEDHFGDNAELDGKVYKTINDFLVANSSDKSQYRRAKQFARSEKMEPVRLRITESGYFKHEHDEIPARMVTGNQQVKSFSHCNACHSRADQGLFSEHDIRIPGYGHWDD